jgi:hypothetical protein
MIPPPKSEPDLTQVDVSQLDSLATAFKVIGVLTVLFGSVFWFHVYIGFSLMMGTEPFGSTSKSPPPPFFGAMFFVVGLFAVLFSYSMGVLSYMAGGWIDNREKFKWCFGVSIALIFIQPLGTVLGILALIVLNRPQVRASFSHR